MSLILSFRHLVFTWRIIPIVALTLLFSVQGVNGGNLSSLSDPLPKGAHIVFLVSKDPDNYEAHTTIPQFAAKLQREEGFKVTVLLGEGPRNASEFPGIEVLSEANLLVVFCRRLALPEKQLDAIQDYLKQGKPLVGIRTANHAFSVREDEDIAEGYKDWWDFVPEILGSVNRGYGPVEPGTDVTIVPEAKDNFILKGIKPAPWHSEGNVYLTGPLLDREATILLMGHVGDKSEPIAWTRKAGNSRIFYTSLGYPSDFNTPQFDKLLTNGIKWALAIN